METLYVTTAPPSVRLGHSTIEIALDTYSHVVPGHDVAAADVMAQAVFGPREALP
jgi:hypothetical protein